MRKATILASAVLLLAPVVSEAKTLEELLVEKGVITKAEAKGATSAAGTKVYWNKGTRVEFPDNGFSFGFATFISNRYEFVDADEDFSETNTSSFSVEKARIIVSGHALHEEFSYYLQADFVGTENEDTGEKISHLRDAVIKWNACDWAAIRMGQFKTQLGRQFNNSDWKLQFPDRSLASDYFDLGRQQGLAADTEWADGMLTLTAGVFNGISDGEGINRVGVDTEHTGVVGIRFNAMGEMDAYEEADVNWTEDAALNFGAAYAYSDANSADFGETEVNDISVDANFKYRGLAIHGEFFTKDIETDAFEDSTTPIGFYGQVGYFLTPKKLEVAVRYSLLDCDVDEDAGTSAGGLCAGHDKVNEAAAAINYYWWKHHLKASLAYFLINQDGITDEDEDENTNTWMLQVSLYG